MTEEKKYIAAVDPIHSDLSLATGFAMVAAKIKNGESVTENSVHELPFRPILDELVQFSTKILEEKKKCYVGIDNGVSGSIGIITATGNSVLYKTPIKNEQSYTKAKNRINRVDVIKLKDLLSICDKSSRVVIERPMVNPKMFKTTLSAMRALEATLCVLEDLGLAYEYIDSKEWQKEMLPSGYKGEELKTASLDIGKRLFPHIDLKHGDRDAILMAEFLRRKYK